MQSWWKHPALWLTLLLSGATISFVLASRAWTAERIANAWRHEMSEAEDSRALVLLQRLADLNEPAIPHLVQLLDDDREAIRRATHDLLREKLADWLRERSPEAQRCIGCVMHEFASQPLPRDAQEQQFVNQTALKLLRWPGEEGEPNATQLLLDCTAVLQRIAETKPLETALAAVSEASWESDPITSSLNDDPPETSLSDASPPEEPVDPIVSPPALPPIRTPPELDPAPPVLPTNGGERLIPPDRFVPDSPRRFRNTELNIRDEEPALELTPSEAPALQPIDASALRALNSRSLIRHLHGLPAIAAAATEELQKRGWQESTITLAKQLDDNDPSVRLKLVEALPYAKQIDAAAWLFELSSDTDPQVRSAARNLLSTSRNPFTQRRLGNIERR